VNQNEQADLDKNISRTVGVSALRKIEKMVAEEQLSESKKIIFMRRFLRYGTILSICVVLLLVYLKR